MAIIINKEALREMNALWLVIITMHNQKCINTHTIITYRGIESLNGQLILYHCDNNNN